MRMFVVGHNITAADITLLVYVIEYFVSDLFMVIIGKYIVRLTRFRETSIPSHIQMD
jgi:hypothetical protein